MSNWETNKSCPDIKSLINLSNIFNVSLDNFIKEDIKEMKEIVEKATIKKFN
ncbi:XRE family transcriptional regulator, partial [[Ruminococcus] torques]|nr:XRE family transcriptional regulator [[Ruminococcus] torques]